MTFIGMSGAVGAMPNMTVWVTINCYLRRGPGSGCRLALGRAHGGEDGEGAIAGLLVELGVTLPFERRMSP